jgi:hypothetical protein
MTREEIIRAIRAGATNAPDIAKFLGADQASVSNLLYKMKAMGRLHLDDIDRSELEGTSGRPARNFTVNEDWQPKSRSPEVMARVAATRAANPEGERRRLDGLKAYNADRAKLKSMGKSCEIPAWVLGPHREMYREIAKFLPEQTAAKWARLAKAAK